MIQPISHSYISIFFCSGSKAKYVLFFVIEVVRIIIAGIKRLLGTSVSVNLTPLGIECCPQNRTACGWAASKTGTDGLTASTTMHVVWLHPQSCTYGLTTSWLARLLSRSKSKMCGGHRPQAPVASNMKGLNLPRAPIGCSREQERKTKEQGKITLGRKTLLVLSPGLPKHWKFHATPVSYWDSD